MFCPKCGSELRKGAFFCSVCGAAIVAPEETEPKDDLNKLENQYQDLMEKKKRKDSLESEIAELKEEIREILKEAEKSADIQKNEGTEGFREDEEQLIEYCPQCGFYVGKNNFCSRCGNRVRN